MRALRNQWQDKEVQKGRRIVANFVKLLRKSRGVPARDKFHDCVLVLYRKRRV